MAKGKSEVNKSQAVREVLGMNPSASVKEIVELLAQKQVQVKPSLVYMVKGRITQMDSHKKKKAARVAKAGQKTGSTDPVSLILRVKELAKDSGGMENLMMLVSVLAD